MKDLTVRKKFHFWTFLLLAVIVFFGIPCFNSVQKGNQNTALVNLLNCMGVLTQMMANSIWEFSFNQSLRPSLEQQIQSLFKFVTEPSKAHTKQVPALAFVNFRFDRNGLTPIFVMTPVCAGILEAFHTLAVDRLFEGNFETVTADGEPPNGGGNRERCKP